MSYRISITSILVFVGFILNTYIKAQTVSDVQSEPVADNKIRIGYILGENTNSCEVNIFYAIGNGSYSGPLKSVTGDVGKGVTGNGRKVITWDVLSDVDSLEGEVSFKVEVEPAQRIIKYPAIGNSSYSDMQGSFKMDIVSVKKLGQTCTIDILLTALDEDIEIAYCTNFIKIIDNLGNQYYPKKFITSSNSLTEFQDGLIKGIPFRLKAEIDNVDEGANEINIIEFSLRKLNRNQSTCSKDAQKLLVKLQVKNIPII
jgi:hypothetical protein